MAFRTYIFLRFVDIWYEYIHNIILVFKEKTPQLMDTIIVGFNIIGFKA